MEKIPGVPTFPLTHVEAVDLKTVAGRSRITVMTYMRVIGPENKFYITLVKIDKWYNTGEIASVLKRIILDLGWFSSGLVYCEAQMPSPRNWNETEPMFFLDPDQRSEQERQKQYYQNE